MNRRIAIISEHASPIASPGGVDSGGQNVYVAQISKSLAKLGFSIDVFTRRDSNSLPETIQFSESVRVWHVPAGPAKYIPKEDLLPFMDEFTSYMVKHCRDYGLYDCIHANFWMSALVGRRLKAVLDIPLVTTFHALGKVRLRHQAATDRFPKERIAIEERVVRESDCLIAECPQDEQDQIELYGADQGKIRIIGCGFDPAEFWPTNPSSARAAVGLPLNDPLIVQIGRMVPRKGVDTAIRALAILIHERASAAKLVIVGGESDEPDPIKTPEIGRLMRLAADLDIFQHVHFVGRRSRELLRLYYSAANVFVTTPWYEPFGITPLESMACGTPVVGSCVGGIQYTVRDGETGFLVPPRDEYALADRLGLLLMDSELRERMSANAIRRVHQNFTWDRIGMELADVYDELIANSASARSHERLVSTPAWQTAVVAQGSPEGAMHR